MSTDPLDMEIAAARYRESKRQYEDDEADLLDDLYQRRIPLDVARTRLEALVSFHPHATSDRGDAARLRFNSVMKRRSQVEGRADALGVEQDAHQLLRSKHAGEAWDMAVEDLIIEPLDLFLTREIETGAPLFTDPAGKVLQRRGDHGRMVGGEKAGKTEVTRHMAYSLITGAKFLDYYDVTPLDDDEVVVILDAENSDADRQAQWSPFKELMTADQWRRIVHLPLATVPCSLYDAGMREKITSLAETLVAGRRVGYLICDSLGSLTGLDSDGFRDPRRAVEWVKGVMGDFRKMWDVDTSMVLMHAPRGMEKLGTEVKPFGGNHWDQQLNPHWVYHYDTSKYEPRWFTVTPGRGGLMTEPVHVNLLANGLLVVDVDRVGETAASLRERAAQEKRDGEALRLAGMATAIWNYVKEQNDAGKEPSARDVKANVNGKGEFITEVINKMLNGKTTHLTLTNKGSDRAYKLCAVEPDEEVADASDELIP